MSNFDGEKQIEVVHSLSESNRFGYSVGRIVVGVEDSSYELLEVISKSDHDVIILRYPNSETTLFAELQNSPTHFPIFADCLLYWECDVSQSELEHVDHATYRSSHANDQIRELVTTTFRTYQSHYRANPLFEEALALEGYVEWVSDLLDNDLATLLVTKSPEGNVAGWAVIQMNKDHPDVALAGVVPDQRGRGFYKPLISAVMLFVKNSGHTKVCISTQAHNVLVMSTWAKLGWLPTAVVTTVHMVKRNLAVNRNLAGNSFELS